MNYEEMTKDELLDRMKTMTIELNKAKDSADFWYKKSQENEKKLESLRSIVFGALNLLEQ